MLYGSAPSYISELLHPYHPDRSLRSMNLSLLHETTARLKTCGDRAFVICSPKLWNAMPQNLRQLEDPEQFKQNLKTYLFAEAF